MTYTKQLFSILAGTVASTVSGALIFGFFLNPFQAKHTVFYEGLMKETENYGMAIIAQIPFAIMFVYIYTCWNARKTFLMGLGSGAYIGACIGLCFALMNLAQMNLIDWVVVITDVFGHAGWGGLTGGVIAWVLGRGE